MNKIASFTVNHLDLLTGAYVSRKDYQGLFFQIQLYITQSKTVLHRLYSLCLHFRLYLFSIRKQQKEY